MKKEISDILLLESCASAPKRLFLLCGKMGLKFSIKGVDLWERNTVILQTGE